MTSLGGYPSVFYSVLLVDRDAAARDAIKAVLDRRREFRVIGAAPTISRACVVARRFDVDLVVIGRVDVHPSFVDQITTLRRMSPYARLIVLATDFPMELVDDRSVVEARVDSDRPDDLVTAILTAIFELVGTVALDVDLREMPVAPTPRLRRPRRS